MCGCSQKDIVMSLGGKKEHPDLEAFSQAATIWDFSWHLYRGRWKSFYYEEK